MEKTRPAARDAHPAEIVKRFNHLDAGEHFWLRALDRVPHEVESLGADRDSRQAA